ncbi:MAG: HEPN domain-containing protein [Desulfobulbaceae bacterium]|nr:HEPN domain-containing protein [Desulfobulbaceae bacterium]
MVDLRKTHSITELVRLLAEYQVDIELTEEDCDLLDSIYLPSKYPLGGVPPDFEPDVAPLCRQCVALAERVAKVHGKWSSGDQPRKRPRS